jgi:hypothetical protein
VIYLCLSLERLFAVSTLECIVGVSRDGWLDLGPPDSRFKSGFIPEPQLMPPDHIPLLLLYTKCITTLILEGQELRRLSSEGWTRLRHIDTQVLPAAAGSFCYYGRESPIYRLPLHFSSTAFRHKQKATTRDLSFNFFSWCIVYFTVKHWNGSPGVKALRFTTAILTLFFHSTISLKESLYLWRLPNAANFLFSSVLRPLSLPVEQTHQISYDNTYRKSTLSTILSDW